MGCRRQSSEECRAPARAARRLAEEPITLEQLAQEFGVSREGVRQIEVRAFEKVQAVVEDRIATIERAPAVL